MKNILHFAINEIGVTEQIGEKHNQQILTYAKEAGFPSVKDDETAWCSIFLNWVAKKSGVKGSNKMNARSWLTVGTKVTNPEPGDVVVYWRESINSWKGHVGIFMGFSKDGSRVYTLGGNQGNAVSISAYKADEVLGYRRLTNASKIVHLPEPTLKKGSKGNEVIVLQDILKMLGYEVGTSDGDFGAKTENGLKLLQSTNKNIAVSGVYDEATKEYINELLKS